MEHHQQQLLDVATVCSLFFEEVPLPLRHLKKLRNLLERFGPVASCEQIDDDGRFVAKFSQAEHALAAKDVLETFNFESENSPPAFRIGWLSDRAIDDRLQAARDKAKAAALAEEQRLAALHSCMLENMFSPEEERATAGDKWAEEIAGEVRSRLGSFNIVQLVVDDWTPKGRVFIQFDCPQPALATRQMLGNKRFGPRTVRAHVISVGQLEQVLQGRVLAKS